MRDASTRAPTHSTFSTLPRSYPLSSLLPPFPVLFDLGLSRDMPKFLPWSFDLSRFYPSKPKISNFSNHHCSLVTRIKITPLMMITASCRKPLIAHLDPLSLFEILYFMQDLTCYSPPPLPSICPDPKSNDPMLIVVNAGLRKVGPPGSICTYKT